MKPSVRTKGREKQPSSSGPAGNSAKTGFPDARKLEQSVMALEESVYSVLDMNKGHAFHDVDFLYWNRRLKNVAMQLSLAMGEHRGPRQFHQHYRHDPKNDEKLRPVSGPAPLVTLARVAREALTDCADMTGITDRVVMAAREKLEQALRRFLHCYHAWQDVREEEMA